MAMSNNDISTDAMAVLEGYDESQNNEGTRLDMNVLLKQMPQQATPVMRHSEVANHFENPHSENMMDYITYFPQDIKDDDIDILIINATEDHSNSISFKRRIIQDITYGKEKLIPRVLLLEDVIPDSKSLQLDYAYSKALYIFIYVTKELCDNVYHILQSHNCLLRALQSEEHKWAVVPVHTCPRQSRDYKLPMMLDGLRALNSFSGTFNKDVQRLLEHKMHLIVERMMTLTDKRQKYFKENYETLIKTPNYLAMSTQSKHGKSLESSLQDSKYDDKLQGATSVDDETSHGITNPKERYLQKNPQQDQISAPIKQASVKDPSLRPKTTFTEYNSLFSMEDADITVDCKENDFSSQKNVQQPHIRLQSVLTSIDKITHKMNLYPTAVKVPTSILCPRPEPDGGEILLQEDTHAKIRASECPSNDGEELSQVDTLGKNWVSEGSPDSGSNAEHYEGTSLSGNSILKNILSQPLGMVHESNDPQNRHSRVDVSKVENTPTTCGPTYNIHIHSATNVVFGKYGRISINPSKKGDEDAVDTSDTDVTDKGNSDNEHFISL